MSDLSREYKKLNNPTVGWLLGRVTRLWRSAISQAVKPLGMTEARWSVLMNLKMVGEGASQNRLATELGIEMPSLNRTVNQLVELDLVERKPHPSDGRCQCLWFTDAGQQCMRALTGRVDSIRGELTQDISEAELATLFNILKKIEHNACVLFNKPSSGDE